MPHALLRADEEAEGVSRGDGVGVNWGVGEAVAASVLVDEAETAAAVGVSAAEGEPCELELALPEIENAPLGDFDSLGDAVVAPDADTEGALDADAEASMEAEGEPEAVPHALLRADEEVEGDSKADRVAVESDDMDAVARVVAETVGMPEGDTELKEESDGDADTELHALLRAEAEDEAVAKTEPVGDTDTRNTVADCSAEGEPRALRLALPDTENDPLGDGDSFAETETAEDTDVEGVPVGDGELLVDAVGKDAVGAIVMV